MLTWLHMFLQASADSNVMLTWAERFCSLEIPRTLGASAIFYLPCSLMREEVLIDCVQASL